MTGTLINMAAILAGGLLGMMIGAHLSERTRRTVMAGLGLFTMAIGIRLFLQSQNEIIVLVSLLIGGLLGEWWGIEARLRRFAGALEARFLAGNGGPDGGDRFVRGFLSSSLLFIIGPMAILGSIQDGLSGDFQLLAIKAVLDGFASLAFASTLGVGVLFSVFVVLAYQGSITLLAAQAQGVMTEPMTAELTAVGGVLLIGLAIGTLLEMREIRTGNLLPALAIAPIVMALISRLA
jgi:uncharacterized membrane protein YqgA involved in biofilm formation